MFDSQSHKKSYKLFVSLLPQVDAFTEPTQEMDELLRVITKEFARFLDEVDKVSKSLPCDLQGILKDRWEKIFDTKNLSAKSAEFGKVYEGRRVIPDSTYFKNLGESFGIKLLFKSSKDQIFLNSKDPIPQELEDLILKVRPAHKEVIFNAQD